MNSWDVFDTLLARRYVNSDIVFEILQDESGIPDFANKRKAADTGSRSLREIYQALADDGVIPADMVDKWVTDEVSLETQQAIPIKETLSMVQHGDLLISDMYMSAPDILRMVRKVGLDKQVTIHQSNDGKRSGRFWLNAKSNGLSIDAHFGDNINSDVNNPIQFGFNGVHFPKAIMKSPVEELLFQKVPALGRLVREIRFANHEPAHQYVFDVASQLNLPFLFFACEMLRRKLKHNQPLVFLGRDCQLLERLYSAFYHSRSYYLPFSRIAAQSKPLAAIGYLKQHTPPDAMLIDLSSTGHTWNVLDNQFDITVLIYSDLFHYTKTKPVPPSRFDWVTSNSLLGQTNELLEVFNCADHGKLIRLEPVSGVTVSLFGEHEIDPETVRVIHKPVNDAIALVHHYPDVLDNLMSVNNDDLFKLLQQFAMSICSNVNVLDKLPDYAEKDARYTLTVS